MTSNIYSINDVLLCVLAPDKYQLAFAVNNTEVFHFNEVKTLVCPYVSLWMVSLDSNFRIIIIINDVQLMF